MSTTNRQLTPEPSPTEPMSGRIARHAWSLLAIAGLVPIGVGIQDFVRGVSPDPTAAFTAPPPFIRAVAFVLVGLGLLIVVTAAIPLRRGEAWAWYTLWVVPAVFVGLATVVFTGGGVVWLVQLPTAFVALIGLLAAYPRVFSAD